MRSQRLRGRAPVRLPLVVAGVLLGLAAGGPAGAQARETRFHTERCPVPVGVVGYPVTVRAADGAPLDGTYARALADAVARRWEPPSAGRGRHPGVERVHSRIYTPEPRWPDDWAPTERHVARLTVTLGRGGRARNIVWGEMTADRAFNNSLTELFTEEPPGGAPLLPELPAEVDSLRVTVGFGAELEAADAGVVRFAAQQTRFRVVPGTLFVSRGQSRSATGDPRAVVKYDVSADGRLIPGTIQVLQSSSPTFDMAVARGLAQARFVPAQSNCRPIAQSVVQRFGRP